MWTMSKLLQAVIKAVLLISFFLFCFKVNLYKQAVQKSLNKSQIKVYSNSSASATPNSQILEHLQDLTAVPLLGRLYEQEKMFQLFRLQRYQDALQLANKVLESPFRQKSFNLWYLKTKTYIQLNLLDEGEQSLSKMSMYAKRRYQHLLVDHYGDMLSKSRDIQNRKQAVFLQNGLELNKQQLEKYLSQKEQKEREEF